MQPIETLLSNYGSSHQNATNKLIHWLCVPAIMFSLLGILYAAPFPFLSEKTWYFNWAAIVLSAALVYYFRLSKPMFLGFLLIGILTLLGNHALALSVGDGTNMVNYSLSIFALAWVGQFIGHKIEGKKPSFLEDIQYLLIGPAWLMQFIFKKIGIKY